MLITPQPIGTWLITLQRGAGGGAGIREVVGGRRGGREDAFGTKGGVCWDC